MVLTVDEFIAQCGDSDRYEFSSIFLNLQLTAQQVFVPWC
jgi:hypothetical protein